MKKTTHKIIGISTALMLMLTPITLTGCMGGGSQPDNSVQVSQTTFQLEENAVNDMCNAALKLQVTGMQRRPTSTFAGSSISGSKTLDGTNDTQVGAASTTDIAIQVDISYTWNINTYINALANAGQNTSSAASSIRSLSDLLRPGELMYIQGYDADGNLYTSADIIVPSPQDNINALAINAQWDYDVLNSALPETSVTKNGSFLIRAPSSVRDLKLVINTPIAGQDVSNVDLTSSNCYIYELPLT